MLNVRFAAVAAFYNLPKTDAQKMVGPNNRVLFHNHYNKVYLVTGEDDIRMVDEIYQQKEQLKSGDASLQGKLNDGLLRFLLIRGHNYVKTTNENRTDRLIEKL